ncbi:Protein Tob1, partial [Galemys pyrenaicus]
RCVHIFGEELERLHQKKSEGCQCPEKPHKRSEFGETVDLVSEQVSAEGGLGIVEARGSLPQEVSVWIDPFEVSYQTGEKGTVEMFYVDDGNENGCELEIKNSFNPETQVFLPIRDSASSSASTSPSPPFAFTPATFAAKFMSTERKNSGCSDKVACTFSVHLSLNVTTSCSESRLFLSALSVWARVFGLPAQPQQYQQPTQPLALPHHSCSNSRKSLLFLLMPGNLFFLICMS